MKTKELLKKAIESVIAQGECSINDACLCVYRGSKGLKCAVGHLIDDEHYHRSLENMTAHDEAVILAVQKSIGRDLSREESGFLRALQRAHDRASSESFVTSFADKIKEIVADGWLPDYCLEFLPN